MAEPLPSNILEWRYVVRGPDDSLYKGGLYHGKLVFPSEFPFKPPSIFMTTPNGRFKTDTRLCLSISDYHPDTWNPAWSVSTILTGQSQSQRENNSGNQFSGFIADLHSTFFCYFDSLTYIDFL